MTDLLVQGMKLQTVDLSQNSSPMKLINNGPHCTARRVRWMQVRKQTEVRGKKRLRGKERETAPCVVGSLSV